MLRSFSAAIEARDPYTRGHSFRVTTLAEAVARWLGWTEGRLETLRIGGALHDVGKLTAPARILSKPGVLTAYEVAAIRTHPAVGARLIAPIRSVRAALPYVLHHYERWDGHGYPHGLRGAAIPVEARVLAVADAFDAMTSGRPYRHALSEQDALLELERCAGYQFDPSSRTRSSPCGATASGRRSPRQRRSREKPRPRPSSGSA
jgi:putative nucleotidyltransferase with HDIG domain